MATLIAEMLRGKPKPVSIGTQDTILEALGRMVPNNYSQLPIVNDANELLGVITDDAIMRGFLHNPRTFSVNMSVEECQEETDTLRADDDLDAALSKIATGKALVVIDTQRVPIGILTDSDMTAILQKLAGDFFLVEAIEVTIRGYIERAFPSPEELNDAVKHVHKKKTFDSLSFREQVAVVAAEPNWPRLERILKPKERFEEFMGDVNQIRNNLMHFRSRPDPVEHDKLLAAHKWLQKRPIPRLPEPTKVQPLPVQAQTPSHVVSIRELDQKYSALEEWLRAQPNKSITLRFEELEAKLLRAPLPSSARKHRAWWANDTAHPAARAWLNAGWKVVYVELKNGSEQVTFQKQRHELIRQFIADVMKRVNVFRPETFSPGRDMGKNSMNLGGGRDGFNFNMGISPTQEVWVELRIMKKDKQWNKLAFDKLKQDQGEIEVEIDTALSWERREKTKWALIRAVHPVNLDGDETNLEETKNWTADMLIRFLKVFQPRIHKL